MQSRSSHKPGWLSVKLPSGPEYRELSRLIREKRLHTVCREANCPNIGDCFSRRVASFMILGNICTRDCAYCNVRHGTPIGLDDEEPRRVAEAVSILGLRYAVITSVTRDDLPDGGAKIFADTVREIRQLSPDCRVEILVPDFGGSEDALKTVLDSGPHVLGHNIETVERLFPLVRPGGSYLRSLELLSQARRASGGRGRSLIKSGLMLGLGESREEIIDTMRELAGVCDILTMGQYLRPSREHIAVDRWYSPDEFAELKSIALDMGFSRVEAGPLVRSSYHADKLSSLCAQENLSKQE